MAVFSFISLILGGGSSAGSFASIGFAFFAVFFYGIMGLVFGIIGALTYNFIASKFGGLQIEVEELN